MRWRPPRSGWYIVGLIAGGVVVLVLHLTGHGNVRFNRAGIYTVSSPSQTSTLPSGTALLDEANTHLLYPTSMSMQQPDPGVPVAASIDSAAVGLSRQDLIEVTDLKGDSYPKPFSWPKYDRAVSAQVGHPVTGAHLSVAAVPSRSYPAFSPKPGIMRQIHILDEYGAAVQITCQWTPAHQAAIAKACTMAVDSAQIY